MVKEKKHIEFIIEDYTVEETNDDIILHVPIKSFSIEVLDNGRTPRR